LIFSHFYSASALSGLVYIVGAGADSCEVLRFAPASGAWILLYIFITSCLFNFWQRFNLRRKKGKLNFRISSGAWSTLTSTLNGRQYNPSFGLSGCLYAAGGHGSESSVTRYDAAADTWTAVSNMLEGRAHFGAVTIGSI
jgi:hypothetical protein